MDFFPYSCVKKILLVTFYILPVVTDYGQSLDFILQYYLHTATYTLLFVFQHVNLYIFVPYPHVQILRYYIFIYIKSVRYGTSGIVIEYCCSSSTVTCWKQPCNRLYAVITNSHFVEKLLF